MIIVFKKKNPTWMDKKKWVVLAFEINRVTTFNGSGGTNSTG